MSRGLCKTDNDRGKARLAGLRSFWPLSISHQAFHEPITAISLAFAFCPVSASRILPKHSPTSDAGQIRLDCSKRVWLQIFVAIVICYIYLLMAVELLRQA